MKVYFNNSCKICRSEINLYKKEKIEEIDWIDITNNSTGEVYLENWEGGIHPEHPFPSNELVEVELVLGGETAPAGAEAPAVAAAVVDVSEMVNLANDGTAVGSSSNFPGDESPEFAIDGDSNTKYLNRDGAGSGLVICVNNRVL